MGAILSRKRNTGRVLPPAAGAPSEPSSTSATLLPTGVINASDAANNSLSSAAAGASAGSSAGSSSSAAPPPPAFAAPAPNPARALVRALKEGDTAKVAELIDGDRENVLLERRGMWENTPLLVACHYGHAATALMLLERGASASATNEQGCTALLFACNECMEALAARLLADACTIVSPPAAMVYSRHTDETAARTPLQAAAESGFTAGVSLLLTKGAPADPSALVLAAKQGQAQACAVLLPALLALPPPPTTAGATYLPWLSEALAAAAARGHESAVQVLCASGGAAASSDSPALRAAAAAAGGAALCAACGLSGADAPASGEGSGVRERIVSCLCDLNVPTNAATDGGGNAPLHLAAAKGLATVVSLLLSIPSADPSRPNSAGLKPDEIARAAGHEELAETLARERATRQPRPPSGRSSLPPLGGGGGGVTPGGGIPPLAGIAATANGTSQFASVPASPLPSAPLPPLVGGTTPLDAVPTRLATPLTAPAMGPAHSDAASGGLGAIAMKPPRSLAPLLTTPAPDATPAATALG